MFSSDVDTYTFLILCLPWLRRFSHKRPFLWINRFKPFFDAYFGQLKTKHQYSVGLFLLVRVSLLVLFTLTSALYPLVSIVATVSVIHVILMLVYLALGEQVYKKMYLSVLEGCFLLNLLLLCVGTLYTQATGQANTAVLFISLILAFVKFLGTGIFHAFVRVRATYITYKRRKSPQTVVESQKRTVPVLNNELYREPLLDTCTN